MNYDANIAGKSILAGGSSTVNVRASTSVDSPVLANVAAGKSMGTATGNVFVDTDYPYVVYNWYELTTTTGKTGYVREDVAVIGSTKQPATDTMNDGSGSKVVEKIKQALATEGTVFPTWAIVAFSIAAVLIVAAIVILIKRRHKK